MTCYMSANLNVRSCNYLTVSWFIRCLVIFHRGLLLDHFKWKKKEKKWLVQPSDLTTRRCLAPAIRDKLKTHFENTAADCCAKLVLPCLFAFPTEICDVKWVLLTLALRMFRRCTSQLLVAATTFYVFVSFFHTLWTFSFHPFTQTRKASSSQFENLVWTFVSCGTAGPAGASNS